MNLRTKFIKENNCMEIDISDFWFNCTIQLTRIEKDILIDALMREKECTINK